MRKTFVPPSVFISVHERFLPTLCGMATLREAELNPNQTATAVDFERLERKNPWNREGIQGFSKSRGDRTAIELFLAGVLNWEARLRQSFSRTVCRNILD